MQKEIEYHYSLPIQLRFSDVDKFGHVNNAVYFNYYDLAKTEYFASVCRTVNWQREAIVVASIEARFVQQILATDHIAVETAVTETGRTSFRLSQRVVDLRTHEVKCVCNSVMVMFDLLRQCPKPLLPEWVEAICRYEGRDVRRVPDAGNPTKSL